MREEQQDELFDRNRPFRRRQVLSAQQKKVPIFEYTPLQVKQSVVGYGRAEKKQVQEMTRLILNLEKIPKPDDTADALAMAICHGHASGSLLGRLGNLR